MRFDGVIKSWDDARGFGFIQPLKGGQDVFVHVKAVVNSGGERPQAGQRVTFEVELGAQGKKRAKSVLLDTASNRRLPRKPRRDSPAAFGTATLLAIPAFAVVYVGAAMLWRVPHWVAALYIGASVVCALGYAMDKAAAARGRWRTRESTLLMLGLVGGWPGALIAQQMLRHKSAKASFRAAFWGTVVMNVAVFVMLAHPVGRGWVALAVW